MIDSNYRRSIWQHNTAYDIELSGLSKAELKEVGRLASVDAAKKRTPPVPLKCLLIISRAVREMPRPRAATQDDLEKYLSTTLQCPGVGIATAICMLAVQRNGEYPPMDKKVASGLRALRKIDAEKMKNLTCGRPTKTAIAAFAETYVRDVIPVWLELRKIRAPSEADNYLASAGRTS